MGFGRKWLGDLSLHPSSSPVDCASPRQPPQSVTMMFVEVARFSIGAAVAYSWGKYVSSPILAVIRAYPKSYGIIRRDGSTAHSAAEAAV